MSKNYQKLLERIYGKSYHDILVDMYTTEGKPIRVIAAEFGISAGTVFKDIKEEGILKKINWK